MKLKKNQPTVSVQPNQKQSTSFGQWIISSLPALIIWNLLFLVTCIPILTIGPAMAAMGFCTNALITDARAKENAAKLYLNAFRASFLKALPIGMYFLFITLLFGGGFFVYSYLSPENAAYVSMSSISLVVLTLFWGVIAHMYPLLFDFDKTDWENKMPAVSALKLRDLISESGRTASACLIPTAIALVFSVLCIGLQFLFIPFTLPLLLTVGFSAVGVAMAMAHSGSPV